MNPPVIKRVTVRYDDREFFEEIRRIDELKLRPEWFLPDVTRLEGRPEKSFVPETG